MKKITLASLFPVAMLAPLYAFAAATPVTVDGGNINFTGAVVTAPCAVDNDTDGMTVKLGQVPTNRFEKKSDLSSQVMFNIGLVGCKLASGIDSTDPTKPANFVSASVIFNGPTVGDDSTLAITSAASGAGDATSAAQNIGVQIFQNGKAMSFNGAASEVQKLHENNQNIPFTAAYVATDKDVVAGSANATATFQVNYQ